MHNDESVYDHRVCYKIVLILNTYIYDHTITIMYHFKIKVLCIEIINR